MILLVYLVFLGQLLHKFIYFSFLSVRHLTDTINVGVQLVDDTIYVGVRLVDDTIYVGVWLVNRYYLCRSAVS